MQYLPDRVDVEKRFPVDVANDLKAIGYTIDRAGEFDERNPGIWGDSELIQVDPKTGELLGGRSRRHRCRGQRRGSRQGQGARRPANEPAAGGAMAAAFAKLKKP